MNFWIIYYIISSSMENLKVIKLNEFWKILSSRILGKQIFEEVEKENFRVVFDFVGVDMVNSWFTDELFWKIVERGITNFKIRNIENNLIKRLILLAMEGRRQNELA